MRFILFILLNLQLVLCSIGQSNFIYFIPDIPEHVYHSDSLGLYLSEKGPYTGVDTVFDTENKRSTRFKFSEGALEEIVTHNAQKRLIRSVYMARNIVVAADFYESGGFKSLINSSQARDEKMQWYENGELSIHTRYEGSIHESFSYDDFVGVHSHYYCDYELDSLCFLKKYMDDTLMISEKYFKPIQFADVDSSAMESLIKRNLKIVSVGPDRDYTDEGELHLEEFFERGWLVKIIEYSSDFFIVKSVDREGNEEIVDYHEY